MVEMMGFNLGRTFYSGSLDKMGVGFDEWRFFKYKSAVEGFARDEMSDADREQRQALIDGFYDEIRDDVYFVYGDFYINQPKKTILSFITDSSSGIPGFYRII